MVYLFYTTIISVNLAHHEIFHAKVGKGGINIIRIALYAYLVDIFKRRSGQILKSFIEAVAARISL